MTVALQVLDRLSFYLETHSRTRDTGSSFRVREGIWAMHEILSSNPDISPDTLDKIARSGRALNGVCDLSVDMAWADELRRAKWWKRRNFAETKDTWKQTKRAELEEAASAEVRQLVTLAN